MGLESYRRKRDFSRTPEPEGAVAPAAGAGRLFVVQKHAASHLHYDFRLEIGGVLRSWAIPRGPSLDPGDRRLAVEVEDHPLAYADFEGVIPEGEYGGGTVMVWDRGQWFPEGDPAAGLVRGKLRFRLEGEKLQGEWTLVRMARPGEGGGPGEHANWLLLKHQDEFARPDAELEITELRTESVRSGRGLDEIAAGGAALRESPVRGEGFPPAAVAPDFIAPQLATLVEDSPREGLWLAETKFDGYRLLAQVEEGEVHLWTRSRQDWSARLPGLVAELQRLPLRTAWLDGELVALDRHGRTSFNRLQQAFSRRGAAADAASLRYYAFDLLFMDGLDLRARPQLERKERLRELLAGTVQEAMGGLPLGGIPLGGAGEAGERCLRYCGHGIGRLDDAFRSACLQGEEGIIVKRADAAYASGRSRDWLKLKCGHRQEFVVGGFTAPEGRREGFGALLVGYYTADGVLAYAGRVGTGFDRATLAQLAQRLQARAQSLCPFAGPLSAAERSEATWVAPELVIDVRFAGWTRLDRLRQARFLGLREDKPAREVQREEPALPGNAEADVPEPAAGAAQGEAGAEGRGQADERIGGVALSHGERLLYPADGISKRDVARYYEAVAPRLLPQLAERPLTLLRCPQGLGSCFVQKHPGPGLPPALKVVTLPPGFGDGRYLVVDTLPALMELVQRDVLELHTLGARADRPDCPDRVVFDLDPGPGVSWAALVERTQLLRELLQEMGLPAFLKSTGGHGVHVEVPLKRVQPLEEVRAFAAGVARLLAGQLPEQFTAQAAKAERRGRVYIDYLRNSPGATAVAAYSLRARPGAPVALPLAWEELPEATPGRFTLRNVPAFLAGRPDPWQSWAHARVRLAPDLLARIGQGE